MAWSVFQNGMLEVAELQNEVTDIAESQKEILIYPA